MIFYKPWFALAFLQNRVLWTELITNSCQSALKIRNLFVILLMLLSIVCCLVAKSCLTLLQPYRVHQAPLSMAFSRQEYVEWVAISSPRGSSWPKDQICISCLAGGYFNTETPGKLVYMLLLFKLGKSAHSGQMNHKSHYLWEDTALQDAKLRVIGWKKWSPFLWTEELI